MFTSLKNQIAFDQVNKFGKKRYSPYFLVVISQNFCPKNQSLSSKPVSPSSRNLFLGIKASKKLGNAPVRNKIKRRIRHIIRILIKKIDLTSHTLAIIVVPRVGFEKVKFELLYDEFEKIFLNFTS